MAKWTTIPITTETRKFLRDEVYAEWLLHHPEDKLALKPRSFDFLLRALGNYYIHGDVKGKQ